MRASTGSNQWHQLVVFLSLATGIFLVLLQMVRLPLASLRRLNGMATGYHNDIQRGSHRPGLANGLEELNGDADNEALPLPPTVTLTTLKPISPTVTLSPQLEYATNTTTTKTCQWTVIAGDSNSRKLYQSWQQQAKQQLKFIKKKRSYTHDSTGGVFEAPRIGKNLVPQKDNNCDPRWMDQEMVLLLPSSQKQSKKVQCHIVSFRFLHHQAKVLEFYQNWTRTEKCGAHLQEWGYFPDAIAEKQQQPFSVMRWTRPIRPHLIWLNHGLWELPNQGKYNATLLSTISCEARFHAILKAIQYWTSPTKTATSPKRHHPEEDIATQIVWQTLFPIHNQHPTITDQYIKWDYQCQLKIMKRDFGYDYVNATKDNNNAADVVVELMDMYKVLAHENRWQQMLAPGDFHLNQNGLSYLLSKLLTKTRALQLR